jgi:hypothetical protein
MSAAGPRLARRKGGFWGGLSPSRKLRIFRCQLPVGPLSIPYSFRRSCVILTSHSKAVGVMHWGRIPLQGVYSAMPASLPKNHSTSNCCLQESNLRSAAGRRPSRALATIMMTLLLTVPLASPTTSAQQRRIQLDDLAKVVTVSDPQISPDGKSIVCVVSRLNFDEDRSDNELVLVDIATGAQRVLTFDRKTWGLGAGPQTAAGWHSLRLCRTPRTRKTTPQKERTARRCSSCR